jgi:hypothetical protein
MDPGFFEAIKNKSRATLELVDIEPKSGATVDMDTEIHAQLRYTLELHPDTVYRVTAQFDTSSPGSSFSGGYPSSHFPLITNSAGEVEIRYPMNYVYRDRKLGHPIRLRFFLLQSVTPTTSFAVAMTEYVEYAIPLLAMRPRPGTR